MSNTPLSLAVVGFRHGHIYDLVARVKEHVGINLVAVCEEDPETYQKVVDAGICDKAFTSYSEMLDSVEYDAVGIGDYFGKRGALIIEALKRGKHVISDKPICTSLDELDQIEALVKESGLSVGCQLDIRDSGNFRTMRKVIQDGEVGEVHAINFGGQHPLFWGTRAGWYFEEGKHGGTLNDIAIHAFDLIPWMTGNEISVINCARAWNARVSEAPHFQDAAQVMLTLENGCGVIGDVSYFAPDSFKYGLPQYWRTTVWGSGGMVETSYSGNEVVLYRDGDETPVSVPLEAGTPGGYLEDFLAEVAGNAASDHISTAVVLRGSRAALQAQRVADTGLRDVKV